MPKPLDKKKGRFFPRDRHFHIAIDVAARHFANGLLLRDLHNYWFSVDPVQQLVVELTERDVLQDGDQHMAEHLHFKGVQLAIDDFGTGNTSLSWLEKLRPEHPEDRPLVHQLGRHR